METEDQVVDLWNVFLIGASTRERLGLEMRFKDEGQREFIKRVKFANPRQRKLECDKLAAALNVNSLEDCVDKRGYRDGYPVRLAVVAEMVPNPCPQGPKQWNYDVMVRQVTVFAIGHILPGEGSWYNLDRFNGGKNNWVKLLNETDRSDPEVRNTAISEISVTIALTNGIKIPLRFDAEHLRSAPEALKAVLKKASGSLDAGRANIVRIRGQGRDLEFSAPLRQETYMGDGWVNPFDFEPELSETEAEHA